MTELYIDGTSVVLPADFSTSVKRENPFFTKNGEYTYDITLQLSNSINADLYAHLNRLNSISELNFQTGLFIGQRGRDCRTPVRLWE